MFAKNTLLPAKVVLAVFFCILLSLITYKAIHVPITHDEKSATVYYPTFSVWEIMKYPDCWPSNHILNSICIKFEERVLGYSVLDVRLHSIFAFVLFFGALVAISIKYFSKNSLLFIIPFFLMFCNAFLLDFYGLARGYGLSNALMATSVCCLLFFASTNNIRLYYATIAFAMLAAYANFTLLIYWAAVNGLLLLLLFARADYQERPVKVKLLHLAVTTVIACLFFALCYGPLYKMQSTNQFIYWSKESFFRDTMVNQVDEFRAGGHWLGLASATVARWAAFFFFIALALSAKALFKNLQSAISNPLVIVSAVLLLVYGINMVQAIALGTPYLTTRTALSYYVLFIFVLMFLMRQAAFHLNPKYWAVLALVVVVAAVGHLYYTFNPKAVMEWWYDANTYTVQNYLQAYIKQHPGTKAVDLNTNWVFNPSFGFYCLTGKTPWINLTEYHKETDTASTTLFYYATFDDTAKLKNYTALEVYPETRSVLMIKKGQI